MSPEHERSIETAIELLSIHVSPERRHHLEVQLDNLRCRYQAARYWYGFPKPAATRNRLNKLSERPQNARPSLPNLLERWKQTEPDTYGLILFQAAFELAPRHPESKVVSGEAEIALIQAAEDDPAKIKEWARLAAVSVDTVTQHGKGGARKRPNLTERDLIYDLGLIYEDVTGDIPSVTTKPVTDEVTGVFVEFVLALQELFGFAMKPPRIKDLLSDIKNSDEPRWKRVGR